MPRCCDGASVRPSADSPPPHALMRVPSLSDTTLYRRCRHALRLHPFRLCATPSAPRPARAQLHKHERSRSNMTVPITAMHTAQKGRLPHPAVQSSARRKCRLPRRSLAILLLIAVSVVILYEVVPSLIDASYVSSFHPHEVRRISRRTLRLYQRQLHLHPLSSRAITAGIIFFIADVSAQLLSTPPSVPLFHEFQFDRLFRYSLYGLIVMGPFLYVWYEAMHTYGPADDLQGSLIKCVFEQMTLEPCCIIMYIVYDAIICRRGWLSTRKTLGTKFLPLWFKNAMFWLPANFANYYIGTPDLRVVFANLCSLFWNIYFSGNVNRPSSQAAKLLNHDRRSAPSTPRRRSSNSV